MYDCNSEVIAFHNEKVTLLQTQRTDMRDRRDANRKRLKDRLEAAGLPLPKEFIKQGSYAMLTMVQDDENDYDIDDGVYFAEGDLVSVGGTPLSPSQLRDRVCTALQDGRFKRKPEVLKSCVRVYYDEGYHVDMPIYRVRGSDGQYELADSDGWVLSRAADVEDWFYKANADKSPDEENGRQFRRIVRYLKKFARSRSSWKKDVASGFTITKLAYECYVPDKERDDVALRKTMKAIYDRLLWNLEVWHPTTPGKRLTSGDDPRVKFFREKLKDALDSLATLDDASCACDDALKAWDKVFGSDFFSLRKLREAAASSGVAVLSNLLIKRPDPRRVDKQGGGRFA